MVAANECDAVRVSYFEAEQEEEGFEGVEAAVDKVTCLSLAQALWVTVIIIPMKR